MIVIQYFNHYTELGNVLLVEQYQEEEDAPIFWRVSFEETVIATNTTRPTKRELDMYSKMVDEQHGAPDVPPVEEEESQEEELPVEEPVEPIEEPDAE